jgi:hypothetical protein
VLVNITLSIDEQIVERARKVLAATGKTVNQAIREHLAHVGGDDQDLKAEIEFLRRTAGTGNSNGWKYNREDAYEGRIWRAEQ